MIGIIAVVRRHIDIPFALEKMKFRRPNLFGAGGSRRRMPDALPMILADVLKLRCPVDPDAVGMGLAEIIICLPPDYPRVSALFNHGICKCRWAGSENGVLIKTGKQA